MRPPAARPIGVTLAGTAKAVRRAFDERLAAAGGSLPVWLILVSVMSGRAGNQRELAAAIGIQGATLTHHLNAMEDDGLLTRRRDPANRRVHLVELTASGVELFHRLRAAAVAHDEQLRTGLTVDDLDRLEALLNRMRLNVDGPGD